jgi:hypothetical protein
MNEYGVSFISTKDWSEALITIQNSVFEITSEDLGAQKAFSPAEGYKLLLKRMGDLLRLA